MSAWRLRLVLLASAIAAASAVTRQGPPALEVNCANQDFHTLKRETNLRASEILVKCGKLPGGSPASARAGGATGPLGVSGPFNIGATDRNVITGTETLPHVVQSEAAIAANGSTVVVAYNDSRDLATNQGTSGISVSHDGGATFTRLGPPSPVATGHGTNFGDPNVVYDQKLGKFFTADLVTGCGAGGIGVWSSTDGDTWPAAGCVLGTADDKPSMAVDNDPTSANYGRLYVSYNDFNIASGAIGVTHSDDGTTWSAPVNVTTGATFFRSVEVGVGPDGRVFIAGENESTGGLSTGAQNLMFHSTDGGVTWNTVAQATIPGTFQNPGETTCGYFAAMAATDATHAWRQQGWGNIAIGPSGVVMYDYAAHGAATDPGDIFLERSTDNGVTWAAPVKLNTDATARAQWMPSLAVTSSGHVVATWYDRRNTTATSDYQRFGRVSNDNGATWGSDQPVSDQIIPQPNQADPSLQLCYQGDYNHIAPSGNSVFDAWTDGRVSISPNGPQQDVFLDRINTLGPTATTNAASGVGVHTATLNGHVNDDSKAGTAHFEYGTTTSYGQTTPVVNLGAAASDQPVGQAVSGLAPNTTYHFRLDATNPDGNDAGGDQTFTTPLGHHRVTIGKSGIGAGTVTSADGQIKCGPTCTHVYQDEDQVTLKPKPAKGSAFHGWSGGGCAGKKPCTFSVAADATIDAIFKPSSAFKFGKPKLNPGRGTAILPVTLPGAGKLSLAGKGIKGIKAHRLGKRVRHAGTVKLKIKPTAKTKKKLNKTGKAKVKAKVKFKITGGDSVTRAKKLKLVKR